MVLVKILGLIDLIASIIFLGMIFSIPLPFQLIIFIGGFLVLKGMFVMSGNIFSGVDLIAAIILFISVFFTPTTIILWIFSLVLMAKGAASFL